MEKNPQYTAPLLEQSRMDIIFVFVVLTDAFFLIMRVEADNQPPSDVMWFNNLWDKLRKFRPRDHFNCILKIWNCLIVYFFFSANTL